MEILYLLERGIICFKILLMVCMTFTFTECSNYICSYRVVSGTVGCFIILRGMSLMGDAISHAVLPGVAISYILGINFLLVRLYLVY